MPDENQLRDPGPLRDEINKKISELFDYNQRVVSVLRAQAHDFELLGGFFETQRQRAFDIAAMSIELAAIASSNTTNIIIAEFGHTDTMGLMDLSGSEDEDEGEDGELTNED